MRCSTVNAGRWFLKRFGWAEIAGKATAIGAALAVSIVVTNGIPIAVAGTLGENVGYYGVLITSTFLFFVRKHAETEHRQYPVIIWQTGRSLLLEFGPSEAFDSFLFRPAFIFFFLALLGNVGWGVLLGSFAADVTFYGWPLLSRRVFPHWVRD